MQLVQLRSRRSGGCGQDGISAEYQGHQDSVHRSYEPEVFSCGLNDRERTASGSPGDIPANAITWKVIIMRGENSDFLKILWNTWELNRAGFSFSWISSAESTKFVDVVKDVTATVKALGPNKNFKKAADKVA